MSRVYRVTGTVTAFFVTDESGDDRLDEIAREVIEDTIEFYGADDAIDRTFGPVWSYSDVDPKHFDSCVFVRSKQYSEDDDLTVSKALNTISKS